jgi:hypothetical protein
MSLDRISERSSIGNTTIDNIVFGYMSKRTGKHVTQQKVERYTADAIMSLAPIVTGSETGFVSTRGTRRRVEALMTLGWPRPYQARQIGMDPTDFVDMLKQDKVTISTHNRVKKLYEKLWNTQATNFRKEDISRAKNYAKKNGYLAPLAWDNIEIDPDPVESKAETKTLDWVIVETAIRGEYSGVLNSEEQLGVLKVMANRGYSDVDIGHVLGIQSSAVHSRRRKHKISSNWVSEGGPGRPQSTKMVA